jgi:hypothetical protein
MLNEITSIEDILKLIDKKQYLSDIFGPGRIFDRMINYPMRIQEVTTESRKTLVLGDLKEIAEDHFSKPVIVSDPIIENENKPEITPIPVKIVKHKIAKRKQNKSSKRRGKVKTQSLDNIFNFPAVKKTSKKSKTKIKNKKSKKIRKSDIKTSEQIGKEIKKDESQIIDSTDKKSELISTDEFNELQKDQLYTNGFKNKDTSPQQQNTESEDENIVCNHCGAIISISEVFNEGCIHCKDQLDAE